MLSLTKCRIQLKLLVFRQKSHIGLNSIANATLTNSKKNCTNLCRSTILSQEQWLLCSDMNLIMLGIRTFAMSTRLCLKLYAPVLLARPTSQLLLTQFVRLTLNQVEIYIHFIYQRKFQERLCLLVLMCATKVLNLQLASVPLLTNSYHSITQIGFSKREDKRLCMGNLKDSSSQLLMHSVRRTTMSILIISQCTEMEQVML